MLRFLDYLKTREGVDEAIDQEKLQQAIDQQRIDPEKFAKAQKVDKDITAYSAAMNLMKKIDEYTDGKKKMWLLQRNTDYRNEPNASSRHIRIEQFKDRVSVAVQQIMRAIQQGEIWHNVTNYTGEEFEPEGGRYGGLLAFIDSLEKQPRPEVEKEGKEKVIIANIIEPLKMLKTALKEYGDMVSEKHPEVFQHHGLLQWRDQQARLGPVQGAPMPFKKPPAAPMAPSAPSSPETPPEADSSFPAEAPKKGFFSRLFGGK